MIISEEEITGIFSRFKLCKVLVVGDVMIDSYLIGNVDRISPEAPVPVVTLRKRENMLGGAANVALNIRSLNAEVILCSVIGADKQGDELLSLLNTAKLPTRGIIRSKQRITTTKFRIMSNHTQMLRVDEEMDTDLNTEDSQTFINSVSELVHSQKPDVIILQDYNKGVLTPGVIESLCEIARKENIPVAVDPKKKNFTVYKGITLFKPNLKEISEGLKTEINPRSETSLRNAAGILHNNQQIEHVMITLSENGVFISSLSESGIASECIPAVMRSIADVSGAGDTVISVAALCLALKTSAPFMAALANLAGGLVCEQSGVVPIDKTKLMAEAFAVL